MRFQPLEPLNHKYLWVNPATNIVHLLVPMMAGKDISLDNTCQQFAEHNSFFSNAVSSLNDYKNKVLADLEFITDEDIRDRKLGIVRQINVYINNFSCIHNASAHARNIVSNQCNLQAAHLQVPNAGSNYFPATFSIGNNNHFLTHMNAAFTNLKVGQNGSNKERFIARVEAAFARKNLPINCAETIAEVIKSLTDTHHVMFGNDFNVNFAISAADIGHLGYDNPNEDTIDSQAELKAIITNIVSRTREELDFPPESSFKTTDPGTLRFATQFLLAEINLFCSSHDISKANFGTILGQNHKLSELLAQTIRTAIQNGLDVEQEICLYINENYRVLGMMQELSPVQIQTIIQRFNTHFRTTKERGHKNELLILETEVPGNTTFISHSNSICLDAAYLMANKIVDPILASAQDELLDLPSALPVNTIDPQNFIDMDIDYLKAFMIEAIYSNNALKLQMLLSVTETNTRVFEDLGRDFFSQFDNDENAQILLEPLANQIHDATIKNRFNRIVGTRMELVITKDQNYRALELAWAVKHNAQTNSARNNALGIVACDLIYDLGIKNSKIVKPNQDRVVIELPAKEAQKFDALIAKFDSAIFLPSKMEDSLYKEVGDSYGKDSNQYKELLKLNTNATYPKNPNHKLARALELLKITTQIEEINENDKGWGEKGFIIKSGDTKLQSKLNEIHIKQQSRIIIDRNAVKTIYKHVADKKGLFRNLNTIANTDKPYKLEIALLSLGFKNDFTITYSGQSDYVINFNPKFEGPNQVRELQRILGIHVYANDVLPFHSVSYDNFIIMNKISEIPKKPLPLVPRTDKEKLEVILAELTNNIRGFTNKRQSWFDKNIDPKVYKLQVIASWLADRDNVLTDAKTNVILGIIEDVCAIKRNQYGLFKPHSLTEFRTMAKNMGFNLDNRVAAHRNAKDLEVLATSVSAIDDFIDKQNNPGLAMNS